MYRQVAVAGELYLPPERERSTAYFKTPAASPRPLALPYTGLHMAVGYPSTVIVSDLLSHMLPADLEAPVMLLGGTGDYPSAMGGTGDYPTIVLSDADVEEVRDLNPTNERPYAFG